MREGGREGGDKEGIRRKGLRLQQLLVLTRMNEEGREGGREGGRAGFSQFLRQQCPDSRGTLSTRHVTLVAGNQDGRPSVHRGLGEDVVQEPEGRREGGREGEE